MSERGAEKFLQEFAGWYVNEWAPPAGSSIEDAARIACAAVTLGMGTCAFRFNGVRVTVGPGDTAEGIVKAFYIGRGDVP